MIGLVYFKKDDFLVLLVSFIVFCSIPPYFIWNFKFFNTMSIFMFFFIFLFIGKNEKISIGQCFLFLGLIFVYVFFSVIDGRNLLGFFEIFLLCLGLLFPMKYLKQVFDCFSSIYALFMIPSLLVYFLVVILGITNLPSQELEAINSLKSYSYIQYPFLLIVDKGLETFRFMAYFDEPGVVGTISGVLLLVCGFRFDKWKTYPILLSGIFSLSFAFYVMLFVNIFLFVRLKKKVLLVGVLIFLGLFFATNDVVVHYVFERFQVEDGRLAGVNRTSNSMDVFMSQYVKSDKFWFGYGNKYAETVVNVGGASYKDLLVNYGFIGFSLLILVSWLCAYKMLGASKNFVVYIFIWGAIIYQRPFIFAFIYFFLLYITLIYLEYNDKYLIHES